MSLNVDDCNELRLRQIAIDLENIPGSQLLVVGLLPRQIPSHLKKSRRYVFWTTDEAVRAQRIPKDTIAVLCSRFIQHKTSLKLNSLTGNAVPVLSNLSLNQIQNMLPESTDTVLLTQEN